METQTLKARAYRAASITVSGHFLSLAIRLLGTIILSRLLSPNVFGIMAVVTTVQTVIGLLTDIGIRPALIQSASAESSAFQDTAWTLQVIRGGVIYAIALLIATLLYAVQTFGLVPSMSTYSDVELPLLMAVSGLVGVILGFQSINAVISSRVLNLGRLTLIDLCAQIGSLIIVVILAYMTRSIWAYVIGGLISAALYVVLSFLWLKGRWARFGWHSKSAAELRQFGKWIFLSSAIGALGLNGDRLLLAALVGPSVLGNFSIATNIAAVPDGVIGRLRGAISFPALSEVWRNQPSRLPEIYWRMRLIMDLAGVGLSGFLFATGPTIILAIYDVRYAPAGQMLQLLSFSLLFSRYELASNVYLTLGHPEFVTLITIVRTFSLFAIVPILFVFFGIDGAIIGIAGHLLPTTIIVMFINQRFHLNSFYREILLLLAWPFGYMVGMPIVYLLRSG